MTCEDFPCCGHEAGCCPDYDENGRQLNMRCTCGAEVPLSNRVSICDECLRQADYDDGFDDEDDFEERDFDDDEPWDGFRDDVEADADVLRSAGWGPDEDYGYSGDDF